jgi:hypothetical protein
MRALTTLVVLAACAVVHAAEAHRADEFETLLRANGATLRTGDVVAAVKKEYVALEDGSDVGAQKGLLASLRAYCKQGKNASPDEYIKVMHSFGGTPIPAAALGSVMPVSLVPPIGALLDCKANVAEMVRKLVSDSTGNMTWPDAVRVSQRLLSDGADNEVLAAWGARNA